MFKFLFVLLVLNEQLRSGPYFIRQNPFLFDQAPILEQNAFIHFPDLL